MPITLLKSLTILSGNGVTASNSGVEYDASEQVIQQISLGQNIGINDNVQFNQVTASSAKLTNNLSISDGGHFLGNMTSLGTTTITGDLTIPTNASIGGKVTAQKITSELSSSSTIFDSGSTQFGNSIDDTHHKTGSLNLSGSFVVNQYSVNEITDDTDLTDGSSTAIVTENAAKAYADANIGALTVEPYLRKNYNKTATLIQNNTASFSAVTASAPSGITATNENDFIFFNNGQVMEHDALTIQQSGSIFYLKVDSDSIGYLLESSDEIKAWGRFNG
jgi:hypothetical protein